jgi:chorismate synthase
MLRFLTAGESHGRAVLVILDGVPAGLALDLDLVRDQLRRRQGGYGRGQRMAIEADAATPISGIRRGKTTGAPITLSIENRDWANWALTMHCEPEPPSDATGARRAPVTRPRPGHADLAGALKYGHQDIRDVLERASARETAARVAAGAVARQLLALVSVRIASHVFAVGDISIDNPHNVPFERIQAIPDASPFHCVDPGAELQMIDAVDRARQAGDTLGGAFEVVATGVPPGLGSYVQWDRRLDGRLAQALMSIPAIKSVGVGLGEQSARVPGSAFHDEIVRRPEGQLSETGLPYLHRPTNRAGGLEGGVTNGEDLRVSAFMKPIATLMRPLRSVDLGTMCEEPAAIERSDVCAVPAAAVIGEAMLALIVADAVMEKFGGDSVDDLVSQFTHWRQRLRDRLAPAREEPPA